MTVLVLDATVLAVNDQLGLLVLRYLSCPIDGVLLAVEQFRITFSAGTTDSPLVIPGNDVLITLAHLSPFCGGMPLYVCTVAKNGADI